MQHHFGGEDCRQSSPFLFSQSQLEMLCGATERNGSSIPFCQPIEEIPNEEADFRAVREVWHVVVDGPSAIYRYAASCNAAPVVARIFTTICKPDQWNYVTANLSSISGKTVSRINDLLRNRIPPRRIFCNENPPQRDCCAIPCWRGLPIQKLKTRIVKC